MDTGIQATHECFMADQVEFGYDIENNFVENEDQKTRISSDIHGHGTKVAGDIHAKSSFFIMLLQTDIT